MYDRNRQGTAVIKQYQGKNAGAHDALGSIAIAWSIPITCGPSCDACGC